MPFLRVKELMQAEFQRIKNENIPVREIAKKIQLSPASLYNYAYNDIDPRNDALVKLATYFKVTPAWLRGESDIRTDYAASQEIIEKSAASRIFESTITGRTPEEQLELMERWLRVVKEYDEGSRKSN